MTNQTLNLVVQSTSAQRFDPTWRAELVQVLGEGGSAVVDVGGGTDMSSDISDNEYEITGTDNVLQRSLSALREFGYAYTAHNEYGIEMSSNHV